MRFLHNILSTDFGLMKYYRKEPKDKLIIMNVLYIMVALIILLLLVYIIYYSDDLQINLLIS